MPRRRESALAYALRLLRIRPRSQRELAERLRRRGYPPEEIENTLRALREAGWLNDREFLESFIRGHLRKLWSPWLIAQDLQRKGFSPEEFQDLLEELWDEENAWLRLQEHARRIHSLARNPEAFRRRLWGFLQRRGYPLEVFHRLVRAVEAGEPLEE